MELISSNLKKHTGNLEDLFNNLEIGVVMIDQHGIVHNWNRFMEEYSGISFAQIQGKDLFKSCPELPETWLRQKIKAAFMYKNRSFINWEQRPHLFPFIKSQPLTGLGNKMYQNITLQPTLNANGDFELLSILVYDVSQIAHSKLKLEQVSQTDGLTHLYNREFMMQSLEKQLAHFHRNKTHASLLIIDVDHFKSINDTYGHLFGDRVLHNLGKMIKESLRKTDIAARLGGEEFAILLPDANRSSANYFARRFHKHLEKLVFCNKNQEFNITVSIGIAQLDGSINNINDWIELADKALYQAKANGRNRTEWA
ncbi:GGDEF domain-containing protein [Paraferrimonas sp. SM1919]|uniref:sensor domain-containing diguanylate cyclase n=1 Tax=Paraferrimonas sp. SM1919 TaxID=2662263 RepID=UPI0013D7AFB5|nr:GGDEF domain-containing protein [Paraferrimonas sp. SM1919]